MTTYRIAEAAELLGVSDDTLRRWVEAGRLRAEQLEGRSVALMANHGAVAHGSSLDQALERALLLEWLCALHHRASALGPVRTLTEEQQHEVVLAALARNYGNQG